MILRCRLCGRAIAEVDLPEFKSGQVSTIRRVMGMFGGGAEAGELEQLLNPTAESLAETFNVRCAAGLEACESNPLLKRMVVRG